MDGKGGVDGEWVVGLRESGRAAGRGEERLHEVAAKLNGEGFIALQG